jgi:2-dehydro-3-deoxyglucarate aldolase/4-hydroxy-2-oxoheptanedioate aldolase
MINLKQKLKNREFVVGMHTSLNDSSITELCGEVGFDFIWVDTEHSAIDYYNLEMHLIAAKAANVNSVVRIPWNDPIMAKRVIEMGPTGIIFPVVNTPDELDRAMKSTLYPPVGTRGFGPVRAVKYGLEDADEYIAKKSFDMVRCVQIESYIAVENMEEMAKNPYVDCFIFGACDLSGSIGELNKVYDKNTRVLIERGIAILTKAGKSTGISIGSDDPKVLKYWFDMGLNFISAGTDYVHIANGSQKVLKCLRDLQEVQ